MKASGEVLEKQEKQSQTKQSAVVNCRALWIPLLGFLQHPCTWNGKSGRFVDGLID
jgi:hypothetical protein